jgi:hypothetical protein
MPPVPVEITRSPHAGTGDEIEFIADVDELSNATVMLGCGT